MIGPSPVAAAEVNAAGITPSQIVCVPEIDPGVKLLTVTRITGVNSMHCEPLRVAVA